MKLSLTPCPDCHALIVEATDDKGLPVRLDIAADVYRVTGYWATDAGVISGLRVQLEHDDSAGRSFAGHRCKKVTR